MRSEDIDRVLQATQQLQDLFQQKLVTSNGLVNDSVQTQVRRFLQATAELVQQLDIRDVQQQAPVHATTQAVGDAHSPQPIGHHWQLTHAPRRPHGRGRASGSSPSFLLQQPVDPQPRRHPQVQLPTSHHQVAAPSAHGEVKQCNCKKSLCLKLYCECFAAGGFCGPHCACVNCNNAPGHEREIQQAKIQILARSPTAFDPKMQGERQTKKGCRCRKTRCLKKYCECFQAGVPCGEACRCESCGNVDPHTGHGGGGGAVLLDTIQHVPPHQAMATPMMDPAMSFGVSPMGVTPRTSHPWPVHAYPIPTMQATPVRGPVLDGPSLKEESVRLTEAESRAPHASAMAPQPSTHNIIVTATPTGARQTMLTVQGGGQVQTLHMMGPAMWAVTPAPVMPTDGGVGDEETRDDATSPPPAMLTKRGMPRTTSVKKPRIRSLADIPPLAFEDLVGGGGGVQQGSNDSGSSTPPDTDVDDPGVTWGRKRGRGARRPASTFEDVMTGETTTLKPLPPSLFNLTSPPRTLGTCEDFRSPPYDKTAARIPQFLHHTVQPKSNKRKSATVGYTGVLASQYGSGAIMSGDKRVNRDLYLDEMAALDTGNGHVPGKENTPVVAASHKKMDGPHGGGGGRHAAERDAVDALCTLSNAEHNAQRV